METIAGLLKPTEGTIKIEGKTDFNLEIIGYLEDDPYLYEYLTVKEIIHYYFLLQNKKISSTKSNQLLSEYSLLNKKDEKIKDLSRGMRQKLAFLLSLIHNPKILLLDEPFTGLNPENLLMMKNKLNQLKNDGLTILLSTHILSFAANICDRVLFIDNGQINYISDGILFFLGFSLSRILKVQGSSIAKNDLTINSSLDIFINNFYGIFNLGFLSVIIVFINGFYFSSFFVFNSMFMAFNFGCNRIAY